MQGDTDIKNMFDNIIEKLAGLTEYLDLLNQNIKQVITATNDNVDRLNKNINRFVNALDNVFHVTEFENVTNELKQLNNVVRYELDKAGVTELLSELAEKVVKFSTLLEPGADQ